jgi:hypothetical protein
MACFVYYLRLFVCYLQRNDVRADGDKRCWGVWIAANTAGGAMDVYKVVEDREIELGIGGGIVKGQTCIALFARWHVCIRE